MAEKGLINHVRLSRCFFFISDVLRQVIENGGIKPAADAQKQPFELSLEKRSQFACSEKPISISEIAATLERSTSVIRDRLRKLGLDAR